MKNKKYIIIAVLAVIVIAVVIVIAQPFKWSEKSFEAVVQETVTQSDGEIRLIVERTTEMFISLVRKYTRARKLTPRMLNELVEKIEVYNAEKIDGVWEQRLRIHYNCVGEITIPKMLPLPIPDVTVNTRKGVFVNYTPAEIAG